MGRSKAEAQAAIRISLPDPEDLSYELDGFVPALEGIVARFRSGSKRERHEHPIQAS
jgi:hypothetical protein